jgi:hypothetical protein
MINQMTIISNQQSRYNIHHLLLHLIHETLIHEIEVLDPVGKTIKIRNMSN